MAKVESAPLYMTNQKQAHFFSLSLSCPGGFIIRIYCFSLLQYGGEWESVGVGWCVELDNQQENSGIKAEFPESIV
ncbi:hypothetical protein HID58_048032 [Brassica napus]|uniref:Uncharacterized protein n=1 Tax=Brassica napus TaxID=3708 RepID=A0ABQ8B0Y3_BRANA|nr:hypothetical protein HID58_048032 [Brassica napus]